jgi:hypothetical protein
LLGGPAAFRFGGESCYRALVTIFPENRRAALAFLHDTVMAPL